MSAALTRFAHVPALSAYRESQATAAKNAVPRAAAATVA